MLLLLLLLLVVVVGWETHPCSLATQATRCGIKAPGRRLNWAFSRHEIKVQPAQGERVLGKGAEEHSG